MEFASTQEEQLEFAPIFYWAAISSLTENEAGVHCTELYESQVATASVPLASVPKATQAELHQVEVTGPGAGPSAAHARGPSAVQECLPQKMRILAAGGSSHAVIAKCTQRTRALEGTRTRLEAWNGWRRDAR